MDPPDEDQVSYKSRVIKSRGISRSGSATSSKSGHGGLRSHDFESAAYWVK